MQPSRGINRMLIEGPESTASMLQDAELTSKTDTHDDSVTPEHNSGGGVLLLGMTILC